MTFRSTFPDNDIIVSMKDDGTKPYMLPITNSFINFLLATGYSATQINNRIPLSGTDYEGLL